ncbi:hypothetical protein JB92DRAFT_2985130 [Gautieria morchelliformis]|nr:hypothetical protein JB92DRAFT_2985130 [Gautieria morchelliformis]
MILLPAVDILIILRVYALFGRSTKIGILLVVLWLAETIVISIGSTTEFIWFSDIVSPAESFYIVSA